MQKDDDWCFTATFEGLPLSGFIIRDVKLLIIFAGNNIFYNEIIEQNMRTVFTK